MVSQYQELREMRLWKGKAFVKTDSYVLHAVTKYSCSARKQLHTFSDSIENEKTNQLVVHISELFCCHAFISQKYFV